MKTTTMTGVIALLVCTIGCGEMEPKGAAWELNNRKNPGEETECQVDPDSCEVGPVILAGEFVSGHLGNYGSCPEEAYQGEDDRASGASADAALVGDCAGEDCGSFNCEGAQVTVRLQNTGETVIEDLEVRQLEIFGSDDEKLADLPLLEVVAVRGGSDFPKALEPGEEVLIRIEFRGPKSPWDFFGPPNAEEDGWRGSHGILLIHVGADAHQPVIIESQPLYPIAEIAT